MRTLRTHPCTFSKDKGLELSAPRSWEELTQAQLRYVFFLQSRFAEPVVVKTYLLLRLCGLKVRRKVAGGAVCTFKSDGDGKARTIYITVWQLQSLLHQFDYIDTYEGMGVRLDGIQGFHAVDVNLHGLCFIDYLNCEGAWQRFLLTQDARHTDRLASLLYRDSKGGEADGLHLSPTEQVAVMAWYGYVKGVFARFFPHLFKPSTGGGKLDGHAILSMQNAQLRALTDGDVTKEKEVEGLDCWRCLTELNEKAREAAEFNSKYGK